MKIPQLQTTSESNHEINMTCLFAKDNLYYFMKQTFYAAVYTF
jgi:hypothetical protein